MATDNMVFTFRGKTYRIDAEGLNWQWQDYGNPPDEAQIKICERWIQIHTTPRETVNDRASSYGLKHRVERWGSYVSNGAFLTAMARLGIEIIPCTLGSPNAFFKLDYKDRAVEL